MIAAAARRFGKTRAIRVYDHFELRRAFVHRQWQLALTGLFEVAAYAVVQHWLLAALALLILTTAEREARRMRACGRYWQCRRGLEVTGL